MYIRSTYLEKRGVASSGSSSELVPVSGVLVHVGFKEGREEWFGEWRVGKGEQLFLQNSIVFEPAFDESIESLPYLKPQFKSIFAGTNFKYL